MSWWADVAVAVALVLVLWIEYRRYRRDLKANSSRFVTTDPKKGPPQDEPGTGTEYGGTHLP